MDDLGALILGDERDPRRHAWGAGAAAALSALEQLYNYRGITAQLTNRTRTAAENQEFDTHAARILNATTNHTLEHHGLVREWRRWRRNRPGDKSAIIRNITNNLASQPTLRYTLPMTSKHLNSISDFAVGGLDHIHTQGYPRRFNVAKL